MFSLNFQVTPEYYREGEGLLIRGVAHTNSLNTLKKIIAITPEAVAHQDFSEVPVVVDHIGRFIYNPARFLEPGDKFDPSLHFWNNPKYKDRQVGQVKILEFENPEITKKISAAGRETNMTISFLALITDPEAIEEVQEGTLDSVSLRWKTQEYSYTDSQQISRVDKHIRVVELSLTAKPVNTDAKITEIIPVDKEKIQELFPDDTVQNAFEEDGKTYAVLETAQALVEVREAPCFYLNIEETPNGLVIT